MSCVLNHIIVFITNIIYICVYSACKWQFWRESEIFVQFGDLNQSVRQHEKIHLLLFSLSSNLARPFALIYFCQLFCRFYWMNWPLFVVSRYLHMTLHAKMFRCSSYLLWANILCVLIVCLVLFFITICAYISGSFPVDSRELKLYCIHLIENCVAIDIKKLFDKLVFQEFLNKFAVD